MASQGWKGLRRFDTHVTRVRLLLAAAAKVMVILITYLSQADPGGSVD